MPSMLVTLFVSNLTGWLKADAPCVPEGSQAHTADRGGAGAKKEARTLNMSPMSVTLDVLKVSGLPPLLKAFAFCRGSYEAGHACVRVGGPRAAVWEPREPR